ncbi:helix-turn-helix transcriptional regulator [Staphylococcus simulans]|uniref:helix-turn-helix transcriptional regulator n=1 Tax=Staphylococcus simulans TaxID=1286 RepID=UPI002DBFCCEF|nr:helix-turn-helix transcriptional regulator [Staphylococcus simulans]MEB6838024.1 helix-turn-helix transcriptional regulator [Staphylococcus simulans]
MKNNVRELRLKKHMSQSVLAQKSDISRQTLSLIEKNNSNPSILIAKKIANILSEKIEDIFILEEKDYR